MRRVGLAIAATTLGVVAPLLSAASSAAMSAAPDASHAHRVRAVVTLAPGTSIPFIVPGVHVIRPLPHIGAELVSATRPRLRRLAHNRHVMGISRNWHGHVTGYRGGDGGTDQAGVLASRAIGGDAGQDGVGDGVTVALLDTGVNDTAALDRASGRLVDGIDVSNLSDGGDAVTQGPFTDGYGHGTFLASLIAGGQVPGSGNAAIGVAPAAHVVVVKVADANGNTSLLQVLAGLDWVACHSDSIQIVNLSLAVDRPTAPEYGADPLSQAVENLRAAGVLVVAAAGNTPGQVGDPGMDPQSLTVGAADVENGRVGAAPFSGSGMVDGVAKPDVVAPGVHVLGVESPDTVIGRSNLQAFDRYGLFRGSGTSEATALTSGVAAAYLSQHPGASPLAVKTAVRVTARSLDSAGTGAGLVSMARGDRRGGKGRLADPTGEATFDQSAWQDNSWLNGEWVDWLASSWSASSWSASSWSASSWSASSWSASSWSASSWSASSWSDAGWGADG